MTLHRTMGRLILIVAFRRYQYGSHHGKGTESRAYHIAHNVSVIIFACPDKTTFRFHDTRHSIVNQGIEILYACCLEFFIVFLIVDILENIFKGMVILLGNSVFCGKPQILFRIQCKIKAASCKALNGLVQVMLSLYNTSSGKLMD